MGSFPANLRVKGVNGCLSKSISWRICSWQQKNLQHDKPNFKIIFNYAITIRVSGIYQFIQPFNGEGSIVTIFWQFHSNCGSARVKISAGVYWILHVLDKSGDL